MKKIDWNSVDWSKYDAKLSKELGVSRTIVGRMRKLRPNAPKSQKKTLLEVDCDRYPTTSTLRNISNWHYSWGHIELLNGIKGIWYYPEFGWQEKRKKDEFGKTIIEYKISTAGWSGNESIIRALQANAMFWSLCWVQSRRGGHYIFHVRIGEP